MTDWGYYQHHESHAHQPIRNERGWNKRIKDTVLPMKDMVVLKTTNSIILFMERQIKCVCFKLFQTHFLHYLPVPVDKITLQQNY